MRKLLILFALISFLEAKVNAEAFDIKKYEIEIQINADGSFDVTEIISLTFNESRRGIIRDIPFRYYYKDRIGGEKANRDYSAPYYDILIRNVFVDGKEFSTSKEDGVFNIKIGSADEYLSGDQTYTIHYKVWGALNTFTDHSEFYWNLIGPSWDCSIRDAEYLISLPKPLNLTGVDALVFTGKKGSEASDATISINGSNISGKLTAPLKPHSGLTLALRFPLNYFKTLEIPLEAYAEKYIIKDLDYSLKINQDASIDVTERYIIHYLKRDSVFTREFRDNTSPDLEKSHTHLVIENLIYSVSGLKSSQLTVHSKLAGEHKQLQIFSTTRHFDSITEFTTSYKLWGAVNFVDGQAFVNTEILNSAFIEPTENISVHISSDQTLSLDKMNLAMYRNISEPLYVSFLFDKKTSTWEAKLQEKITGNTSIDFKGNCNADGLSLSSIPISIYSENFLIKNITANFSIGTDGVLQADKSFLINYFNFLWGESLFSDEVRVTFPDHLARYSGISYTIPDWSLMASRHKTLLLDLSSEQSNMYVQDDWSNMTKVVSWSNYTDSANIALKYMFRIYGLLKSDGDSYILNIPLVGPFIEPVETGTFTITLPENKKLSPSVYEAYIDSKEMEPMKVPLLIRDNIVTINLISGLMPGQALLINLRFPKAYISDSNKWHNVSLIWKNNSFLLFPIFFFIALFILWIIIGRDRRMPIVVQYKPPSDITPAEAGLLWDNKLHRRDLVSLIYHWAASGHLKIEETGEGASKDYTLIKTSDLPTNVKSFEKTIFTGLFTGRESVRVGHLRNIFYSTMQSAGKQLETYGKTSKFFVPGTRGFGRALRIIAWLEIVAGIIVMLATKHGLMQVFLCFTSLFAMLILFGNLMPRRDHFGAAKMNMLRGFYEFMERTDMDKLDQLMKQNPRYFEQTIAYAIVMGIGKQWADKFNALVTEPPLWLVGHKGTFETSVFVNEMLRSMHKMEHDMNYHYTPPSNSSGSSFSYNSSSSSSHSSYGGGGGSAFGGGGHSGGGFGGGGGKSW